MPTMPAPAHGARTTGSRQATRLAAAVLAFPLLLLVAAACGSSGTSSVASSSAQGAPAANAPGGLYGAPAPSPDTAAAGAHGGATVAVATVAGFGQILVDAQGRTLYLFTADHGTTSACTGGCLGSWPPATAPSPTAGPGVDGSLLATANAAAPNQLVYHGHLLYRFAGDQAPGQVNGTAIPKWYPVSPDGDAVTNG